MSDPRAFLDAVRKGDASTVKAMLARDRGLANARTEKGFSAVTVAAYHGHEDLLREILAHGPTMTVHEAALAGDLARVRELVEKGPKLANDTSSPDGFPPLGLAAHRGRAEVVTYLLSKGANVNFAAPGLGFTALTGAVAGGHAQAVRLLIEAGADVNHRYEDAQFTPLITAAAEGGIAIVTMLLDAGADANARTTDGKTPLSMAVRKGDADVADLLRRRGAKA